MQGACRMAASHLISWISRTQRTPITVTRFLSSDGSRCLMVPRRDLHDGQFAHARHARTARRAILPRRIAVLVFRKELDADPNQRHDPRRPASPEGRFGRSSRYVERGMRWTRWCRGAPVRADDRCQRGCRSRVVLTPRRWCQACGAIRWVRGARKPGPPGEREGQR